MDYQPGKASIVEALLFCAYCNVVILDVNIFPAKSLPTFIASVTEDFRSPHTRVREEIDESTVTTGFDRGFSVVTNVIDSFACLFIDEGGKLVTVIGGSGLLVAALVTTVVGDGLGSVASLGDVLGKVPLTNGPTTERRDVRVVGADGSCGPALASEMPSVFAEMA